MTALLAVTVWITGTLIFYALFAAMTYPRRHIAARLRRYLDAGTDQARLTKRTPRADRLDGFKRVVRDALPKRRSERLERLLQQAGVPLSPEEYVLFQWIAAALGAGTLYLISTDLLLTAAGGIAGLAAPRWFVRRKSRRRIAGFNDGLPDLIVSMIGSLRAGFSFAQALKAVSEEASSPVKEETEAVLHEMQYGVSVEDALNRWKERMPSEDLNLMVQAILIQRQVGGNLAVILEAILQTIRDRNAIQRQVKTLTSQGKLSGLVIGLLPAVLGGLIYLIQPDYVAVLFRHPIGIAMLCGGAVSGLTGFMLIRKITTIEV